MPVNISQIYFLVLLFTFVWSFNFNVSENLLRSTMWVTNITNICNIKNIEVKNVKLILIIYLI